MAIANLNEIKLLANINTSANDDFINGLLPIIEDTIINYCNNRFYDTRVQLESSKISFNSNNNTITVQNANFETNKFKSGYTIEIFNSMDNNGRFTITNVSGNTITVLEDLMDEDSGEYISITKVVYPKQVKEVAAKMIKFDIDNKVSVKSESLADYSVTYNNNTAEINNGYPQSILSQLNPYRNLRW